ncbi:hypothetical protein LshimejAT787_0600130 [Lyophyllum shimeji]|uniref:Uncharacterized protein n=1 Tax=Lyophyllum shimeji TaxID=47721 RepID=A0A9P3PP53_LYOSH|nr:hypothetical protein LshimejAT787_0600130 [Lyophyllum shimeji]
MPPQEYSLRLQKGIVGGFAPAIPDAIHTVTKPISASHLTITSAVRPSGQPSLRESFAPKNIPAAHSDTDALVAELHGILKELPMEKPPGSEDIYGMNTSIAWGSDDLEWCNGGPQGCGGGKSEVQPTEEQKAKFRRAVDIVEELVRKDV